MAGVQGVSSNITTQLYSGENTDPKDILEYGKEWADLIGKKQECEAWLAGAKITSDDGGRLSYKAYHTRRQEIIRVRAKCEKRMAYLKSIKNNYKETPVSKRFMTNKVKAEILLDGDDPKVVILKKCSEIDNLLKDVRFLLGNLWIEKE